MSRRTARASIVGLLAGGMFLFLLGCAPKGTSAITIPEADGSDADLAVDESGGIHVTWSGKAREKEGTYYQFSSDGAHWTLPVRVGKADPGRVFASGSTMHFVTIYGGRHYSSHDHGRTWSERDRLIPIVVGGRTKFDGCCFGDTLMLAYLYSDEPNSVVCMNVARFVGDREIDRKTIGRIPFIWMNHHEPRLWNDGHSLWLVGTISSSVNNTNVSRHHSTIRLWSSSDRGSSWTSIPGPELEDGPVEDLRPTVVWAAPGPSTRLALAWRGIRIQRWEGAGWMEERRISARPQSFGLGPEYFFDSAIRGNLTALAWIDDRGESDLSDWIASFQHLGEPGHMGGTPYAGNSVLVALDRGEVTGPRVTRLTKARSHALNVRVTMWGDELLVLWSAVVGSGFDAHRPTRVYFARIPLGGASTN